MPKDTERKMIDEVAAIISEYVEGAGTTEARRAAVAIINRLADSYDEMENPEPAQE
jgi:hypothetical protein